MFLLLDQHRAIKYMKDVSCVHLLNFVQNVPIVALDLHVGARLHQFWEKWPSLGASQKVITVLQEGYTCPFLICTYLTRTPTIISCYVNPLKNSYLMEALHALMQKNAVEPVTTQKSQGFYKTFPGSKTQQPDRPILDLNILTKFLKTESFKMETPGTVRTSLQAGKWVTSIDFKDMYFHLSIQSRFRKYMLFYVKGQSYNFRALPFGLCTAPTEFTVVTKEVKPIALQKGIRIHQNVNDDWSSSNLSGVRLVGQHGEIGNGPQTSL